MNTRFFNGLICTMENDTPEVFEGELWVHGDRVAYAGAPKIPAPMFDREINLRGNLLIPGFKNAHTHSAMTFLRSYADDMPLLDWLEHQVFPMEAKLSQGDCYWLSRLAILEYLSSGITANMDMYMFAAEHARASIDSGFRTVLCGALHNFIGSLQQLEQDFDHFSHLHPLISAQLGFHAEYTCSPELLAGISQVVHRRKLPVYMHSSESRREVDECLARTGLTPTQWMDSLGLLDFGGGAYHCVHMSDEDLAVMKKRGMAVVSCPGSNTKLASGIARLADMLEMGIPVALGTDGPASNNCLDFFREMFLATGLQKLSRGDASAMKAEDILTMATVAGARAMGLAQCTSLASGQYADLVVIDLQQPNMQPVNHVLKNLVYSGCKQNVKLTMVNGRVLYENGEFFVGENPAVIYERANDIIKRISESCA